MCDEKHFAALHRALDKYYHITAGQKMADFFEGVGRSVQVRGMSRSGVGNWCMRFAAVQAEYEQHDRSLST